MHAFNTINSINKSLMKYKCIYIYIYINNPGEEDRKIHKTLP